MTLDDILNSGNGAYEDVHEVLLINPVTRKIEVPSVELVLGVETDRDSEIKAFIIPAKVGANVGVCDCSIRVYYRNANGDEDYYAVDSVETLDDGSVLFVWLLGPNVTKYKGDVQFSVCLCKTVDGLVCNEWNTTTAIGKVLEGLEPTEHMDEEFIPDIVQQLEAYATRAENAAMHQPIIADNGNWAVWDGEKYVDTGVPAACETDDTLSVTGKPADAKATGDALKKKLYLTGGELTGPVSIKHADYVDPTISSNFYGYRGLGLRVGVNEADYVNDVESKDSPTLKCDPYARIRFEGEGGYKDNYKKGLFSFELGDRIANSRISGDGYTTRLIPLALDKRQSLVFDLINQTIKFYPMSSNGNAEPSCEVLHTGNIIDWGIANMDAWTPFFGAFNIGRVEKKSYTGTGTYGEKNRKSITFNFQPKAVIIKRRIGSIPTNADGTEKTKSVNDATMIVFYGDGAAVSSILLGDTSYAYSTKFSWSGKTISWWGISETKHLNLSGSTYNVLAIG